MLLTKDEINERLKLDPLTTGTCTSAIFETWQFTFPNEEMALSWLSVAQRVANKNKGEARISITPKMKRIDSELRQIGINYYGYIFWQRQ